MRRRRHVGGHGATTLLRRAQAVLRIITNGTDEKQRRSEYVREQERVRTSGRLSTPKGRGSSSRRRVVASSPTDERRLVKIRHVGRIQAAFLALSS
jgi:hypothetical protein